MNGLKHSWYVNLSFIHHPAWTVPQYGPIWCESSKHEELRFSHLTKTGCQGHGITQLLIPLYTIHSCK